jgi:hypothetical protein
VRNTPNVKAERYRVREGLMASDASYGNNGAFLVPVGRAVLAVVVSDEDGWDHVSVSLPSRCPTWEEMCAVKELFFRDDEAAVEYHPPKADYVNHHPYCLHLWRPQGQELPLPPAWMVGPDAVAGAEDRRG